MSTDLFTDWVDAMSVLRMGISPYGIRDILQSTAMRWSSPKETGVEAAKFRFRNTEQSTILVNPRIERFYKVERVEILCCIGLHMHQFLTKKGNNEMLLIYQGLGIHPITLINPVHRWRYIHARKDYRTVAVARFEDRPECPICHIGVPTGHENPKIHDGCREYVKHVYVPALKAQRKAEAQSHATS